MRLFPVPCMLLAGCYTNANQDELDDILARVEALEAENASLRAKLPSDMADGETLVVTTDLAGYATTADLDAEEAARVAGDADLQGQVDDIGLAYTPIVSFTSLQDDVADLAMVTEAAILDHETRLATIEDDYVTTTAFDLALMDYALYADAVALADAAYLAANAYSDGNVDPLATEIAALTTSIDAVTASVTALDGAVVHIIRADETWNVATETELLAAIEALDDYHIASDATVTIQLAAGDYYFTEALLFHHPDGGRVEVIGDETYPNNVNLYFSGSHGIVVDEGSALGYVGGVALWGDGSAASGLYITDSSTTHAGPMEIHDFGNWGLHVSGGSYVEGESTSTSGWLAIAGSGQGGVSVSDASAAELGAFEVTDSDYWGARAYGSSYLGAIGASASGGAYYGFEADRASAIEAQSSSASGFDRAGYQSQMSSTINATYSTSSANEVGFYASLGGTIAADGTTSASDVFRSHYAQYHAAIFAYNASVTGGGDAFVALEESVIHANNTDVSGISGTAYTTYTNSFISAAGYEGDSTTATGYNDTTDFIQGL